MQRILLLVCFCLVLGNVFSQTDTAYKQSDSSSQKLDKLIAKRKAQVANGSNSSTVFKRNPLLFGGFIDFSSGGPNVITIASGTVPPKILNIEYAFDGCSHQYNYFANHYGWEYSVDNGVSWIGGIGSQQVDYQPPALTETRWYRRYVFALDYPGGCAPDWNESNVVIINVVPAYDAGSITANSVFCTPDVLINSVSTASGGVAPYTYSWERKVSSSWQNLNITSETLTEINAPYGGGIQYRRKATSANGLSVYSNIVIIDHIPPAVISNAGNGNVITCGNSFILQTTAINGVTYQWQQKISGVFQNINSATNTSYTAIQNGEYRLATTSACGVSYSAPVTISLSEAPGDPNVFGNNNWTVYGFNGLSDNINNLSYKGYYELLNGVLNFNTNTHWAELSSPSSIPVNHPNTTIWNGCAVNTDEFTIIAKRKGFSCGSYNLQVTAYPYARVKIVVNGQQLFSNFNPYSGYTNPTLQVYLDANSTVEVWTMDVINSVSPNSAVRLGVNLTLSSGGVATSPSGNISECWSDHTIVALTPASSYQWQQLVDGSYVDIPNATANYYVARHSGSYRVKAVAVCGSGVSAPVVIKLSAIPEIDPFITYGEGTWRFYGYNGISEQVYNSRFRGYFEYSIYAHYNFYEATEWSRSLSPSALPANPIQSTPWIGCSVDNDNFTLVAKRRGFACGNYNLRVRAGENETYIVFINGNKVAEGTNPNGSSAFVTIPGSPYQLNSTSTIEVRFQHRTGQFRGDWEMDLLNQTLTPGSVQPVTQTIDSGSAAATLTTITDGNSTIGNLQYQWQKATVSTGPWSDISNATSNTYSPGVVPTTTYYRRSVTNGTCEGPKYSNVIVVNVNGVALNAGSISSTSSGSCNNYSVQLQNVSAATGGSVPYNYQWQWKQTSSNFWNDLYNATGLSHNLNVNQSIHLRRKVTDVAGNVAYSNVITINISATDLKAGMIKVVNRFICEGSVAPTIESIMNACETCGTVIYGWEKNEGNAWVTINGANSSSYSPGNIIVATKFRRKVIDGANAVKYSNEIEMVIYPSPIAGSISAEMQHIQPGQTPALLVSTAASHYTNGSVSYQWQESSNANSGWIDIVNANANQYQPSALTQTKYYRLKIISSTCNAIAYSTIATVNVH